MQTITISKTTARCFVLGRQGLWPGRRWAGQEGTVQALRTIDEVRMDPSCRRSQSRCRAVESREWISASLLFHLLSNEHQL
jgi:hypothetical protein